MLESQRSNGRIRRTERTHRVRTRLSLEWLENRRLMAGTDVIKINPAATFYRTGSVPSANSAPIDLATLGFQGGDYITLGRLGDYSRQLGRFPDTEKGMAGVFSSSSQLLARTTLHRVTGAIDAGNDTYSEPAVSGSLPTDISEDFDIQDFTFIQIPLMARYLFVSPYDSYFDDNVDPDGNYALEIGHAITIVTPNAPTPNQLAISHSTYVGLEGVYQAKPNSPVLVEALNGASHVVSSTVVTTDSVGRWDAVVFGGPTVQSVRASDPAQPTVIDTVYVSCRSLPMGFRIATDYQALHKGDLVLSTGKEALQRQVYGANFTHASVYVGPDPNGTPMITEAIFDPSATLRRSLGRVVTVPLDKSEAFLERVNANIYGIPGKDQAARDAVASFAKAQIGKPYWVGGFAALHSMGSLFSLTQVPGPMTEIYRLRYNVAKLVLNDLINSRSTYICSTLPRTAYLVGYGIDIASPNLTSRGGIWAAFGQDFWNELRSDGLAVFPDTLAASGKLTRIT